MSTSATTSAPDRWPLLPTAVLGLFGAAIAVLYWRFQDMYSAGYGIAAIATFLVAGVILITRNGAAQLLDRTLSAPAANAKRNVTILIGVTFVILLAIARLLLDGFLNSGDEYAFALQAETYAQGRLWVPAPADVEPFVVTRIFDKGGIWISQYQPGWALMLAPLSALHLPLWLLNPILGAVTLAVFFMLARRYLSEQSAWLAVLALAVSSFFLLNFASYFGHGMGALAAVSSALFIKRYLERGLLRDALFAGALVGYLGFARVFNAAILILPIFVTLLATRERRVGILAFGIGGAPFLAAFLAHNYAVTGNPMLMVTTWVLTGAEPIGVPDASFLIENAQRLKRLVIWTSPVLVFAWAAAIPVLAKARRLDFTDWIAPSTLLFFFFYGGDGGNQYGPRYYFEALPFFVLTCAKLADHFLGGERPAAANLAAAAVLAHFAYQAGFMLPRFVYEQRVVYERQEPYRLVREAGLSNAVVLLATDASTARPMIPTDLTRNGLVVGDESVTYALDLGPDNAKTRAMFPGRTFYRYKLGSLTRIECAPEGPC